MSSRLISGTVIALVIALGTVGCSADDASPSAGAEASSASPSPTGNGGAKDGGAGSATSESGDGAGDGSSASDAPSSAQKEPTGAPAESAQPSKKGKQTAVFGRVPGSASESCVKVGGRRDVRSGGFVGGPFDTAASTWKAKQPGKPRRTARLYWVPLNTKKMPGVKVVATSSSTGKRVVEEKSNHNDAEQWKYYDTQLKLPTAGTWTLRVTSGSDRGCFVMTLRG